MDKDKEMQKLKAQLDDLYQDIQEISGETGDIAKDRAQKKLEELKQRTSQYWDKTKYAGSKAKDYMEEHPLQSVAIAFAAGIVVGMIASKKRKD